MPEPEGTTDDQASLSTEFVISRREGLTSVLSGISMHSFRALSSLVEPLEGHRGIHLKRVPKALRDRGIPDGLHSSMRVLPVPWHPDNIHVDTLRSQLRMTFRKCKGSICPRNSILNIRAPAVVQQPE